MSPHTNSFDRHKIFGKIVQSLRKQQSNKRGKIDISVAELAERTGKKLPAQVIANIETGRKKYLQDDELDVLAQALRLSPFERREFFYAAIAHESTLEEQTNSPVIEKDSIAKLLNLSIPAGVVDGYGDYVAGNNLMTSIYRIPPEAIAIYRRKPAGFNMMTIVFEYLHPLGAFDEQRWEQIAYENIMLFRRLTLRYRHEPYF